MSSQRSSTGQLDTLEYKSHGVAVTFGGTPSASLYPADIDPLAAHVVKFTIRRPAPSASPVQPFDTGLHFHIDKAEALRVEKGAIGVQLGKEKLILTPESGELVIPRWTVHGWWFHVDPDHPTNDEAIVWERTIPASREKEAFFRVIFSYMGDLPKGKIPSLLQMCCIFNRWDNFPILRPWWGDVFGARMGVIVLTQGTSWLGMLFGFSGLYPEYVPTDLYELVK
jgi:hypothetical protein